jgi:superfamily II DNA/RNA helicase
MQSFAELGVSPNVARALARRGITEPFAIQRLAIGDVMAGHDVLVKSPTGSGKTLAFGIPLVERIAANGPTPSALVLAPTRELASQITKELEEIARARSLRVCAVYGGVGIGAQARAAGRAHIVVATPGRLEDLLERRSISLGAVRLLVLDEADRMLDMGFRPAVDRIVKACPTDRQTMFFSATLDGLAGQVASRYTTDAVVHEHTPAVTTSVAKVEHRFVPVTADDRMDALMGELRGERDLALVFVRTKRGADRLAKKLHGEGVKVAAIHGDKSQRQREVALSRFQSGSVDTLVATDVAARGIDVASVSHVINFDVPDGHDTYVHRVGRTGRAGRGGVGVTLVADADAHEMRRIANRLGIKHNLGGERRAHERPQPRGNASRRRRRPRAGTANGR